MDNGFPIAVTGIGIVSPIGCGHGEFWSALREGRSGIAPLDDSSASNGLPRIGAALRTFDPREFIASAHRRRMDKLSCMVVAAAQMAARDARLPDRQPAGDRLSIVVGSAYGNVGESVSHLNRLLTKGPSLVSPMMFPNLVLNAPASYSGMELQSTGPNLTVSHLEASAEHALIQAADLLRLGRADVVVAGGGDVLHPIITAAYRQASALSSQNGGLEWCSPYDRERNGVVLGEGAAMMVLESAERARGHEVDVYAEIESDFLFSVPCPTHDWPAPAESLAPWVLERLRQELRTQEVDLILGAGNSSRKLDAFEIEFYARLTGQQAKSIWLSSIKGAVGEFGAAGALTAATAALALRNQQVPPLCQMRDPDPAAPFRFAAGTAVPAPIERCLLCTVARGGSGAALAFRRSKSP